MKTASLIPVDGFNKSRAWRSGRLAPLAVLVILIPGFMASWVSASRDHPARVSFMDGCAAYETSGDVDWNEVTLNLPLVGGDRIMAHPDSRIEVELGDGNFVRISGETDVLFPELSRQKTILKLHEGDVILRVNDASRVQVESEPASIRIRMKGLYRIHADRDGSIRLVVHDGLAEVSSRHGKERVETGQQLLLDARQIGIQAVVRDLDNFEQWSGRRDARLASSRSTGYLGGVSYPGVQSLDRHGHWAQYGSHGRVWVPNVAEGWAPFRDGRWCYLAGGWTWVSYEPWGWLPYHYGHWIYHGPMGRWAWVPGGFNRWHAAHVDFYWGNGHVGWAPKGYYGRSRQRGGNTTVVVQNNIFENWNPRNRSNGLTVVLGNDLGRRSVRTRRARSRVVASNAIVGSFRQGLPRRFRGPRVRGRISVSSRSGIRSSRSASQSTGRARGRVVGGGSRRSTVVQSGGGSRVRVPSRRSTVTRSDRTGATRSVIRQRSDSRKSGRSGASVTRTPTRNLKSSRPSSSKRSVSRSSPKSKGSVNKRTSRNQARPTVSSSGKRSVSRSSPKSKGSVNKRTSRNQARSTVSSSGKRSKPTSQKTVSRPEDQSSPRPSSRARSAPKRSGSSEADSGSRRSSKRRK